MSTDLAHGVRQILETLKIGSDGKPSSASIEGWRIALSERIPGVDDADVFAVLTLTRPDGREARIGLGADALHTKGRSIWRRSNCWRLTPEAVTRWADPLQLAIAKHQGGAT